MIFDTHAHYDDRAFSTDRDALIHDLYNNNITKIVNVGSSLDSSKQTVDIVNRYNYFYGAVGVHPSEVMELSEDNFHVLEELVNNDRIVAIGEIGLDYHYDEPNIDIQKKWFIKQLDFAREKNLPVIIHSRDAAKDTFDIMRDKKAEELGGVIHCYSYSASMAMDYVKMGFYIGVGGVVTFKNARKLIETVEAVPIESIVLETDCPYLSPVPYRGERNSSLRLPYVIKKIAEIKGISDREVEDITYNNALNLYRIREK